MFRFVAGLLALLASASIASAEDWPTRPDPSLTPGAVDEAITIDEICDTIWGDEQRVITAEDKAAVLAAYHFNVRQCPLTEIKRNNVRRKVRRSEFDHLVSCELGGAGCKHRGATVRKNLWPQCYEPVEKVKAQQAWGAHKKDRLENELHRRVCAARSPELLSEYRRKIAADWIALYGEIFGDD